MINRKINRKLYVDFTPKSVKNQWITTERYSGARVVDKKALGVWRARREGTKIKVSLTKASYVEMAREERDPVKRVKFMEQYSFAPVAPDEVPCVETPRSCMDRDKLHYDLARLRKQEALLLEEISRKQSRINHRNVMKELRQFSSMTSVAKSIKSGVALDANREFCKYLTRTVLQAEGDGLLSVGIKASTIADLEKLISNIPKSIDVNVGVQSPVVAIRSLLDTIWNAMEAQPLLSGVVALALTGVLIPVIGFKNAMAVLMLGSTALNLYKYGPLVSEHVQNLLRSLGMLQQRENDVRVQSEFDFGKYKKILDIIGAFVTSVLLGMSCAKSVSKSDVTSFVSTVSRADKISSNVSSGIDWLLSLLTGFIDWIDGKIKLPDWLMKRLPRPQDRNPEFYVLYDKATKFIESAQKEFDISMSAQANLLYTELNVYYASIERVPEMSTFRQDIQQLRQAMIPLLNCFQGSANTNNTRFRTVWFNFTGESGVGKSTLMNDFALLVFSSRCTEEEWKAYEEDHSILTFPYNPEIDYWTNYKNQFCTMIDELGLTVEIAGLNTDGWMQLIRMVNIFIMPLDMPDIPRKGKMNFLSKLLLTTTNRKHISTLKNISHVPALHSRCAGNFQVAPSRRYALSRDGKPLKKDRSNWKLNFMQIIADKRDGLYKRKFTGDMPHLEFLEKDMATAEPVGEWKSFQELYDYAMHCFDETQQYTDSIIKDSNELFKQLQANRAMGIHGPSIISDIRMARADLNARKLDPEIMMEKIIQEEIDSQSVESDTSSAGYETSDEGENDEIPEEEEDRRDLNTQIVDFLNSITNDKAEDLAQTPKKVIIETYEALTQNPLRPEVEIGKTATALFEFIKYPFTQDDYGLTPIGRKVLEMISAPEKGVYGVLENCANDLNVAMTAKKLGYHHPNELKILSKVLNVPLKDVEDLAKSFGRVQGREDLFIQKVKDLDCQVLTEREIRLISELTGFKPDIIYEMSQVYGPVKVTEVQKFIDYIQSELVMPKIRLMSEGRTNWITKIKNFMGFAVPILSGVAAVWTIYNLWNGKGDAVPEDCINPCESAIPEDTNTVVVPMSGKAQKGGRKWKATLQGEYFDNIAFNLTSLVYKNILVCYVDTEVKMRAHFTCIGHGLMLGFSHYFSSDEADADKKVTLVNIDGTVYHTSTIKEFMASSKNLPHLAEDLIVSLVRKQPKQKILKKFALRNEGLHSFDPSGVMEGTIMKWSNNNGFRTYLQVPAKLSNVQKVRIPTLWNPDGKSFKDEDNYLVNFAVTAAVRTEVGSCGLPYFDSKGNIVGLHCAGSGDKGVGVALCREDIEDILRDFGVYNEEPDVAVPSLPVVQPAGLGLHSETGLQHGLVGVLPFSYSNPQSKIKPTKYFDVFKPKFKPAMVRAGLYGGQIYDPQKIARLKVRSVEMSVPSKLMNVAADYHTAFVLKNITTAPCGRRMLSFDEAVDGIPDVYGGLPRKTSPGYPYSTENRVGGKKYWIGEPYEEKNTNAQVKFRQQCEAEMQEAMLGSRPLNVFKDSTKVELRDEHKVMTPRQICAYSAKGSVNTRRLTGSFVASYMGSNFNVGSGLGMNVHGEDFEMYVRKLCANCPNLKFRNKIFADYKLFDRLQIMMLGQKFTEMVNLFYAGEDVEVTEARRLYLMDLYNSFHVANIETTTVPTEGLLIVDEDGSIQERPMPRAQLTVEFPHYGEVTNYSYVSRVVDGQTIYTITVLYSWYGGTSSGHPLTTIFNDFCNHVYINMAAAACVLDIDATMDITDSQVLICIEVFGEIIVITFGDDHVISVGQKFLNQITFRRMKKWMLSMGMGYTPANKEGEDYDHLNIYESSFLKRTAIWSDVLGRHIGALPIEVIENIPCWEDAQSDINTTRERVEEFFKEMSYHGEALFITGRNKIMPVLEPSHMPKSFDWKVNLLTAASYESVYF